MIHEMKTFHKNFSEMLSGKKNFVLLKQDKPYREGDTLIVREWSDIMNSYSGERLTYTISCIYEGCGKYGLAKGYCVLGLRRAKNEC